MSEIKKYQSLLEQTAKVFGPDSEVNVFDGKLFSRWAIGLDKVPSEKMSYEKYLGKGYVGAISSLEACQ